MIIIRKYFYRNSLDSKFLRIVSENIYFIGKNDDDKFIIIHQNIIAYMYLIKN